MQRSDSCLFLTMGAGESDYDTHPSSGGFAVCDEHVVRTSLESIGIRCNDECIEKLCHDVLCLDEAGRRSREDHGQLLLLKVSDVIKVLEMMTDDGTCTRLVEDCICSNSINGRPAECGANRSYDRIV